MNRVWRRFSVLAVAVGGTIGLMMGVGAIVNVIGALVNSTGSPPSALPETNYARNPMASVVQSEYPTPPPPYPTPVTPEATFIVSTKSPATPHAVSTPPMRVMPLGDSPLVSEAKGSNSSPAAIVAHSS